jgi:hypothetical protein
MTDIDQEDQVAYRRLDEVGDGGRSLTDTEIYEGALEVGADDDAATPNLSGGPETLTELDLRSDETADPSVAAEEGLTYVPPLDPPVVADSEDPQGVVMAAGFGVSALDEPYDDSHRAELLSDESDLSARVREAILADAATSRYADTIIIGSRGGEVVLRGWVDDIEDSDAVAAVAERVTGVVEVIEELEVRALEQ